MINAVGEGFGGKISYVFSFRLQKRVPIAHSAVLEGKPRTINTRNGWSSSVKAKREFMKNKQITGNVNQGQWSTYKHCCAIPRAVRKKNERFRVERWSLSVEGMDTDPKHQSFRARLKNCDQLMKSERRMMSPHHSAVPHFSTGLWLCDNTVLTPNSLPSLSRHTQTCTVCADDNAWGPTIRERWGTFSKCQQ